MQRKDLAKEFSLLVQQEMKNHADAVLASNMAIDEFRRKIDEFKEESGKRMADVFSRLLAYNGALDELQGKVASSVYDCTRRIADLSKSNEANLKSILRSMDERESYFLTLEG